MSDSSSEKIPVDRKYKVIERLEKKLERSICEERFYEFFIRAFCQLHPGTPYDENWHAEYLCDRLQEEAERVWDGRPRGKDLIINMPFRAAKSMITTVIFPVWCWIRNPRTKFICVSFAESLALEHSQYSRNLILGTWFQMLWGDKIYFDANQNSKAHYANSEGGSRKSVGTGGQITGSGSDIIIIDDPQDPKRAASEVERQNSIDFYDKTLFSRLNQPDVGVRIIVMQRLHEGDLSGYLLENRPEDHNHICIPAEWDEDIASPKDIKKHYVDGLFWSTRFNRKTLKSFEKTLTPLGAAGQLQQRPAPLSGNLVKRDWFPIIPASSVKRNDRIQPIMFLMDTAYTAKQENDPSGIMAIFKDESEDCIYIVNVSEVRLEFPDLIKYTKEYVARNGYSGSSSIWVEPKASGKSLVQQLKASDNFNISEISGDFLSDDKLTRLSSVSHLIYSGRVRLVEGDWNEKYLNQLCMFPSAKHDEFVDLTCYACFLFLTGSNFDFFFI